MKQGNSKGTKSIRRIDREHVALHVAEIDKSEFDYIERREQKAGWHWEIDSLVGEAEFARWLGVTDPEAPESRAVEFRCGKRRMVFLIGSITFVKDIYWQDHGYFIGTPYYLCELRERVELVEGVAEEAAA